MKAYAAATKVSPERTRAEIETLLGKHGASRRQLGVDEDLNLARIEFVMHGRSYRLDVPLPKAELKDGQRKPDGWSRMNEAQRERCLRDRANAESGARWRSILLMLKAKLELVRLGVSSVEREFLADMLLANGKTMHLAVAEAIKRGLDTGKAPTLALPPSIEER